MIIQGKRTSSPFTCAYSALRIYRRGTSNECELSHHAFHSKGDEGECIASAEDWPNNKDGIDTFYRHWSRANNNVLGKKNENRHQAKLGTIKDSHRNTHRTAIALWNEGEDDKANGRGT
jgi:hypothetical protein